jgi:hypothetical protein
MVPRPLGVVGEGSRGLPVESDDAAEGGDEAEGAVRAEGDVVCGVSDRKAAGLAGGEVDYGDAAGIAGDEGLLAVGSDDEAVGSFPDRDRPGGLAGGETSAPIRGIG